ncbi:MAG: hypothetical protein R3F43_12010 [bacterium]
MALPSLPDLVARAEIVVRGWWSRSSAWEGDHLHDHAPHVREIQRKRRLADPDVQQLGGEAGGLALRVAGQASFTVGEEVIVFAKAGPRQAEVVGMAQGVWRVRRGPPRVGRPRSRAASAGSPWSAPTGPSRCRPRPPRS